MQASLLRNGLAGTLLSDRRQGLVQDGGRAAGSTTLPAQAGWCIDRICFPTPCTMEGGNDAGLTHMQRRADLHVLECDGVSCWRTPCRPWLGKSSQASIFTIIGSAPPPMFIFFLQSREQALLKVLPLRCRPRGGRETKLAAPDVGRHTKAARTQNEKRPVHSRGAGSQVSPGPTRSLATAGGIWSPCKTFRRAPRQNPPRCM